MCVYYVRRVGCSGLYYTGLQCTLYTLINNACTWYVCTMYGRFAETICATKVYTVHYTLSLKIHVPDLARHLRCVYYGHRCTVYTVQSKVTIHLPDLARRLMCVYYVRKVDWSDLYYKGVQCTLYTLIKNACTWYVCTMYGRFAETICATKVYSVHCTLWLAMHVHDTCVLCTEGLLIPFVLQRCTLYTIQYTD